MGQKTHRNSESTFLINVRIKTTYVRRNLTYNDKLLLIMWTKSGEATPRSEHETLMQGLGTGTDCRLGYLSMN